LTTTKKENIITFMFFIVAHGWPAKLMQRFGLSPMASSAAETQFTFHSVMELHWHCLALFFSSSTMSLAQTPDVSSLGMM
jgi:hypothetical protein